jgi:hypothetical protein
MDLDVIVVEEDEETVKSMQSALPLSSAMTLCGLLGERSTRKIPSESTKFGHQTV